MTDDATLAAILTISALVPFSERGMAIYEIDGGAPQLAASAWGAASAQGMGRVLLGADASVWFGAVIRGATESITVGAGPRTYRPAACCMPTGASPCSLASA